LHYQDPFTYISNWFLIAVHVLRADGTEADHNELGRIVCKLPLPPGTMSTLYKAPERFLEVYFSKYKVSYVIFFLNRIVTRILTEAYRKKEGIQTENEYGWGGLVEINRRM
jgi:hypothetical protein